MTTQLVVTVIKPFEIHKLPIQAPHESAAVLELLYPHGVPRKARELTEYPISLMTPPAELSVLGVLRAARALMGIADGQTAAARNQFARRQCGAAIRSASNRRQNNFPGGSYRHAER